MQFIKKHNKGTPSIVTMTMEEVDKLDHESIKTLKLKPGDVIVIPEETGYNTRFIRRDFNGKFIVTSPISRTLKVQRPTGYNIPKRSVQRDKEHLRTIDHLGSEW